MLGQARKPGDAALKRLLYIPHRPPYPPDKGERIRAWNQVRALTAAFDVTVAYAAHAGVEPAAPEPPPSCGARLVTARATATARRIRAGMSLLAGRSATEGYFRCPDLMQKLKALHASKPFDLVFGFCSSVLPYIEALSGAAKAMDLVDVDSAKWAAYAEQAAPPRRWLYAREAAAVRRLEERAIRECGAVFVTSEAEKRLLGEAGAGVIPVGNGVDCDYFRPSEAEKAGGGLVFVGQMDYPPNVQAVCWFADNVWPELRQEAPDAAFVIVGRAPAPAVQRLARRESIQVTGEVPDVRPYLHGAAGAIAPLRTARGVQNKVLEAMAAGKAVIGSSAALEGLDVTPGADVLQADAPQEWVQTALRLLREPEFRKGLGRNARDTALRLYSWEGRLAPLVAACRRLCETADASAPAAEAVAR